MPGRGCSISSGLGVPKKWHNLVKMILCGLTMKGREERGGGEVVGYKERAGHWYKDPTLFYMAHGPHSVGRRGRDVS